MANDHLQNTLNLHHNMISWCIFLDQNNQFVSVDVVKGGAEAGSYHQVDGITGGTITSDGVTNMLKSDLEVYNNYFDKIRE